MLEEVEIPFAGRMGENSRLSSDKSPPAVLARTSLSSPILVAVAKIGLCLEPRAVGQRLKRSNRRLESSQTHQGAHPSRPMKLRKFVGNRSR